MTNICGHDHVYRKYALQRDSAYSSHDVHNGTLQWDTASFARFVHIRLTSGSHGLALATSTMAVKNHDIPYAVKTYWRSTLSKR